MAETIKIAGEIESTATGNKVADIANVKDKTKGDKSQAEINAEHETALADRYSKAETYNKSELNNMITTPSQEFETYTATDQDTDISDILPSEGSADTVYRVGNWDGSQFDETVYSEYAWNGSEYIHLSTKTQIGEVFDISAYHATGGTLATYADLAAALDSNNGGGVPQSLQKGGMSVKFVHTSDNKYVQFRLMSDSFNTTVANWQGVDDEPVDGSENLVKSGGVAKLKTDKLGLYNNKLDINGLINPIDLFELGSFKVENDVPSYSDNNARVRIKKGGTIYLKEHDIIRLSTYTDRRFYLYHIDNNGDWNIDGSFHHDFSLIESGWYVIVVIDTTGTEHASAEDLASIVFIERKLGDTEPVAGSNNQIRSGAAFKLKSDEKSIYNHELDIKGELSIAEMFEIGAIDLSGNAPSYVYRDSRIRTKEGSSIYLRKGDKIVTTDNSTTQFCLSYYNDNGEWCYVEGWYQYDYILPANGYYYFVLRGIPESTISDVNALASRLVIKRHSIKQDINILTNSICAHDNFVLEGNDVNIISKTFEIEENQYFRLYPQNLSWNISNIPSGLSVFIIKCGERKVVEIKSEKFRELQDWYDITSNVGETELSIFVRADIGETIGFKLIDYDYLKNTVFDLQFISQSINPNTLESGGIRVEDGALVYYDTNRIRLNEQTLIYLPSNCYIRLATNIVPRFVVLYRLSDGTWTTSGWITNGLYITEHSGYCTLIFNTTYSEEKATEISNNILIRKGCYGEIDGVKETISKTYPAGEKTYYGPRVCLDKANETYKCNIEKLYEEAYGNNGVNPLIYTQSSVAFNDLVFVFLDTSTTYSAGLLCKIFDLRTNTFVSSILNTLDENGHLNGACFTSVYYDIEDTFPLLLLSSGSSSYSNWCKVVRILTTEVNNETVYSVSLIKTIRFDTATLTHTRFGTTCIDEINDCLWFYGYKDYTNPLGIDVRECWFHKFPIPDLTDSNDVIYGKSDVIRIIKYPYRVAGQDMDIYNGKAYMAGVDLGDFPGFPTTSPARNVTIVNLSTGEIENMIPSIDSAETEGISVYNNSLIVTSRNYGVEHSSTDIIFHITKWTFG